MEFSFPVGDGLCPRCGAPVMRGQSFCARCHASFVPRAHAVPARGVRFWLWVLPLVVLCVGLGSSSCYLIWKAVQEELARPRPWQMGELIGFLAGIVFALAGSLALAFEIRRRWREDKD